jgi:hypothetical protein
MEHNMTDEQKELQDAIDEGRARMAHLSELTGTEKGAAVFKGAAGIPSRAILADVLESLEWAEAMGGPVGLDYIALMDAVIAEASQRRENVVVQMAIDQHERLRKEAK